MKLFLLLSVVSVFMFFGCGSKKGNVDDFDDSDLIGDVEQIDTSDFEMKDQEDSDDVFFDSDSIENDDELDEDVVAGASLDDIADEGDKDIADGLKEQGIETAEELFETVNSAAALNQIVESMQIDNVFINSGRVIRFIKKAERHVVFKELMSETDLKEITVEKINETGMSVMEIRDMLLIHSLFFGTNPGVTAEDLLKKDQKRAWDNLFSEMSIDQLSEDEFETLRNAFSEVMLRANPLMLTGSAQKTNDGRFMSDAPLNAVVEASSDFTETPSEFLEWEANGNEACQYFSMQYPITISKKDGSKEAMPPFSYDETGSDLRQFFLPETGVAFFSVFSSTGGVFQLKDKDNNIVFSAALNSNEAKFIHLPIFENMVCTPFYSSKNFDFTLLKIEQSDELASQDEDEDIPTVFFNGKIDSDNFMSLVPVKHFFFNMLSKKPTVSVKFNAAANGEADPVDFVATLISPSSKSYTVNENDEIEVNSENGKWRVFIHEKNLLSIDENFIINEIAPSSYGAQGEGVDVSYSLSVKFEPIKTKKFVVGKLDFSAFSRDGETDGERGEIRITLSTNMAPANNIDSSWDPENIGSLQQYQAWRCWSTNKEPWPFTEEGACKDHIAGFEAIKADSGFSPCSGYLGCLSSYYEDNEWLYLDAYGRKASIDKTMTTYSAIANNDATQYVNWLKSVVQINNITFPYGPNYGITDSSDQIVSYQSAGSVTYPVFSYERFHPVVPLDIPFFGVPKERLKDSAIPLSFDYSALELDKLNKKAMFGAFMNLVVNSAISIATLDFLNGVCGMVEFLQTKRDLEKNAEDDPLGNANFKLNRYSTTHSFYGLDDGLNSFFISGYSEDVQEKYSMYERGLDFAKLACTISDIAGVSVSSIEALSSMDKDFNNVFYNGADDLDSVKEKIMSSNPDLTLAQIAEIETAFEKIGEGTLEENFEAMLMAVDILGSLSAGRDVFTTKEEVSENLNSIGGAAKLGYNLSKSQGYFHFNGYEDRKTQGKVTTGIVRSIPVKNLSVTVDKFHLYSVMEKAPDHPFTGDPLPVPGGAENYPGQVWVQSRVGVISDGTPDYDCEGAQFVGKDSVPYFENGNDDYTTIEGYPFRSLVKRKFPVVNMPAQTDYPFADKNLFKAAYTGDNNTAAIYVEIGAYEDDGGNVDDDMIGVFSQTFLLEDFFSKSRQYEWTEISAGKYRITVSDYPVYGPYHQATIVAIGTENAERQALHNKERLDHPSGTVSFHIDIELGELESYPDFPTDIKEDETETYDMEAIVFNTVFSSDTYKNQRFASVGENVIVTRNQNRSSLNVYEINESEMGYSLGYKFNLNQDMFFRTNYYGAELTGDEKHLVVLARKESTAPFSLTVINIEGVEPVEIDSVEIDGVAFKMAMLADGKSVAVSLRNDPDDLILYEISGSGTITKLSETTHLPYTITSLLAYENGLLLAKSTRFVSEADILDKENFYTDLYPEEFNREHFLMLLERDGNDLILLDKISFFGGLKDFTAGDRDRSHSFYKQFIEADSNNYPIRKDSNSASFGGTIVSALDDNGSTETFVRWIQEGGSYFLKDPKQYNEKVSVYDHGSFVYSRKAGKKHPENPFYCRNDVFEQFNMCNSMYCAPAEGYLECHLPGNETVKTYDKPVRQFEYLKKDSRYMIAVLTNGTIEIIDLFYVEPECVSGNEQTITCVTDENKFQKQVCTGGFWEDEGACYEANTNFPRTHGSLNWSEPSVDYMTWSAANSYCENLGGRLPTVSELRGLLRNCADSELSGSCGVKDDCLKDTCKDNTCNGCGFDFENPGKYSVFGDDGPFWTSSLMPLDSGYPWTVDFTSASIMYHPKNNSNLTICVQGAEKQNYTMVTKSLKTWEEADAYCKSSNRRLPTISEARTLIKNCDKTAPYGICKVSDNCLEYTSSCWNEGDCRCEIEGEEGEPPSTFGVWTSSLKAGDSDYAWVVDYTNRGVVDVLNKNEKIQVTCITDESSNNFPRNHSGLKWSFSSRNFYNGIVGEPRLTYDEANSYCSNIGGRLPTISELRSLVTSCPDVQAGGSCGVVDSCLEFSCMDDCYDCCNCKYSEGLDYFVFDEIVMFWTRFWSSSILSDGSNQHWGLIFDERPFIGGFHYGVKVITSELDHQNNAICVKD
jgi:hypothetical protein